MLVVSPERKKESSLRRAGHHGADAALERRRASSPTRKRAGAVRHRLRLGREPRQSRSAEPGSGVADLRARTGLQPARRRASTRSTSGTGSGGGRERRRDRHRRERGDRRLHPDAVHLRASTAAIFDLEHLFRGSPPSPPTTATARCEVSGRLLTIQSVKLAPRSDHGGRRQGQAEAHRHGHRDRLRAARQPGADRRRDRRPRRPPRAPRRRQLGQLHDRARRGEGDPMNDFSHRSQVPTSPTAGCCPSSALVAACWWPRSPTRCSAAARATRRPRRRDRLRRRRTPRGIAVTATTPEHAVAETTDGFERTERGHGRNPFAPLPGASDDRDARLGATTGAAFEHDLILGQLERDGRNEHGLLGLELGRKQLRSSSRTRQPKPRRRKPSRRPSTTWRSVRRPARGHDTRNGRSSPLTTKLKLQRRCPPRRRR